MKLAYRMLAAGQLAAHADAAAPEQHYLPFDGVTDFAYADAGATGYTTQYAVVLKMATLPTTNAGWPVPIHLSVSSASPWANNVTDSDQMPAGAPNQHRHVGVTTAGAVSFTRVNVGQCAGAQVHMLGRDLTANTARMRVIKASDQSVFWGPADAATTQDSAPDDICIGGYLNPGLTRNSSPCDLQLIAVVFLDSIPSDADLQLYADPDCRDARPIFGSSIKGYWAASSAVGSSIPALIGTAPVTLSGPVAGDLVAMPAAVTSYYSSPGGAGDYAEASTSVAVATMFPGTSEVSWTLAFWLTRALSDTFDEYLMEVGKSGGQPNLVAWTSDSNNDNYLQDSLYDGTNQGGVYAAYPDLSAPTRLAWTFDGTTLRRYTNGALTDTATGAPGAFAWTQAGDVFRLLAQVTGSELDADIRNIIVNDRAHTAGEEAALYAAGPTHNPLAGTGAWAGGQSIPVLWTTAAVAGVVSNSGDGGACNLVLNGAVTSEVDP